MCVCVCVRGVGGGGGGVMRVYVEFDSILRLEVVVQVWSMVLRFECMGLCEWEMVVALWNMVLGVRVCTYGLWVWVKKVWLSACAAAHLSCSHSQIRRS